MARFRLDTSELDILKELKNIKKINGQIRTATVEINDPRVAKYAIPTDGKSNPNYHYSDGDGTDVDFFSIPEVKSSISNIVSGKRRASSELDDISLAMAKAAANHVVDFIEAGAHRNYQAWKGTNDENLIVTGDLRDSIVGVAYHKKKEIGRGR